MIEEGCPFWIFILETHVNHGVHNFVLGHSLFEAECHPKMFECRGPLGCKLLKRKARPTKILSDWYVYFDSLEYETDPQHVGKLSAFTKMKVDWIEVDWIEVINDFKGA